jgi:hypothetical protein
MLLVFPFHLHRVRLFNSNLKRSMQAVIWSIRCVVSVISISNPERHRMQLEHVERLDSDPRIATFVS